MSYDLSYVRDPEEANPQEPIIEDMKGRGGRKESNHLMHGGF